MKTLELPMSAHEAAYAAHRVEVQKLMTLMDKNYMLLRVPFDNESAAALVQRPNATLWNVAPVDPVPVSDKGILDTLICNLRHMCCHNVLNRCGWKEIGLDGDKADWYSFVC
jgi:hypothetical protein